MTPTHWPWTVLEIAPTEDRKTIREAYARLLKALDHEAETEAYMQLRHARDAALSGEFLRPPHDAEPDEDDFGLGHPLPEGEPPASESHSGAESDAPDFTVEYSDEDDQRFHRIVELFLGEGALRQGEIAELHSHLDTLFADDRMADLGHYARVETWLAQLLADRYPRGAALFSHIAEQFHWADRAHELGIHPAIPWLFNAHEAQTLVQSIETPGHAYHREWVELTRGAVKGPLWTRSASSERMANLIATIRRDYPWLEQEHWQPELVARWDRKVSGGGVKGPNPWFWLVMFAILLSTVGRVIDDNTESSSPTTEDVLRVYSNIESPELAIAGFIRQEFPDAAADGVDVASLRNANGKFYDELVALWEKHKLSPDALVKAYHAAAARRYFAAIDRLSQETLQEELRHRQYVLSQFGSESQYPLCARFVRDPEAFVADPANEEYLAGNYRYHMFKAVGYLPADGAPVAPAWPSDATFTRIAAQSGLPAAILKTALAGQAGSDALLCRATKALYAAALDLPRNEAQPLVSAIIAGTPR